MIPLFDVQDQRVVPSVHCYAIPWLKKIMDHFPNDYLEIYKYIFYLTCPDSTLNPYRNIAEDDRDTVLLADLKPTFYLEDLLILETIERCKKMYETPVLRAFVGAKKMLDKVATYLDVEEITDGQEGNATTIRGIMKELPDYWNTYRKMEEELNKDQAKVRGGNKIRYDQMPGYTNSKED